MALPIKETPILRDQDAEEFRKRLEQADTSRVSEEEYRRARETYRKISENSAVSI